MDRLVGRGVGGRDSRTEAWWKVSKTTTRGFMNRVTWHTWVEPGLRLEPRFHLRGHSWPSGISFDSAVHGASYSVKPCVSLVGASRSEMAFLWSS